MVKRNYSVHHHTFVRFFFFSWAEHPMSTWQSLGRMYHSPLAVRAVQGDCQFPMKNGRNSQESRGSTMNRHTRQSQPVLRPTNHKCQLGAMSHTPITTLLPPGSDCHYDDVTMSGMASQITSLRIVNSTVYPGPDQRKHQSPASLAFVREFTGDRWIPSTNGQ